MALVKLSVQDMILSGFAPLAGAVVTATYWAGSGPYKGVKGEQVRFAASVPHTFVEDTLVFDALPTDGVMCVRWSIYDPETKRFLTRYTEIPDVWEIDFGDLVDVDPETFAPSAEGQAAWDAAVASAQVAVAGAVAARDVATAARVAAEGAAVVSTEASATVGAAVATVEAARDQAVSAESGASGAKFAAETARDDAVAAKDAAQAVPARVSTAMSEVLADPEDPFTTGLFAKTAELVEEVTPGILAADPTIIAAVGTALDVQTPPRVATEIATQLPAAVTTEVGLQVPPAVALEITDKVPSAVTAETALRVPPAVKHRLVCCGWRHPLAQR